MAKIIKNLKIQWNWAGDVNALRSFNVAITPSTSDPKTMSVVAANTLGNLSASTYSYTFYNVTLDGTLQYTAWVQACYDGMDGDWISAGNVAVSDDGTATVATTAGLSTVANNAASDAQSKADAAKSTAISTAASDATNKVNNIQIGGRNLFLDTKNMDVANICWYQSYSGTRAVSWNSNGTYNGLSVRSYNGPWAGLTQNTTLVSGQIYTMSAYIRVVTPGSARLYAYVASGATINTYGGFTNGATPPTSWTRIWFTFTVTTTGIIYPRFELDTTAATDICGLKLEQGNKATDWTPAPEDVQTQIDTSNTNITSLSTQFKDLVNCSVSGNTITKTGANNGWDAGFATVGSVVDGQFIECVVNNASDFWMFGLSNSNADAIYTSIQFAAYCNNGIFQVWETGTQKAIYGAIKTGDITRVAYEAGKINYYLNGSLKYTSLITPSTTLYGDASIYTLNAKIKNVRIGTLDVVNIANRVSTAETSITQLNNSIALKAAQTDLNTTNSNVTGLATRMSTAEATLTVQAGQIASKVTQTDIDNAVPFSGTATASTDFTGKIAGNTTANPNICKYLVSSAYEPVVSSYTTECTQANYDNIKAQDSNSYTITYSGSAGINISILFCMNVINAVESKCGTIKATDKIQWIKNNITSISFYISGSDVFKGNSNYWASTHNANGSTYSSQLLGNTFSMSISDFDLTNAIDSNGYVYMSISGGGSTSTGSISLSIDYVKLDVSINAPLNNIINRVTTAESSITQNANNIALKVSKDSIISSINQSAEAISINANKLNLTGYITATNLQTAGQTTINGANIQTGTLTADKIQVGAIGGVNLVKNSGFRNGLTNWNFSEWRAAGSCSSGTMYDNWCVPDGDCINKTGYIGSAAYVLVGGTTDIDVGGTLVSDFINCKSSFKYTAQFLYGIHRGLFACEIKFYDSSKTYISLVSNAYDATANSILSLTPATCSPQIITFTTPSNAAYMTIGFALQHSYNNAYMFIDHVKLEEGGVATAWSPSPNESKSQYILFEDDGMKVYNNSGVMKAKVGQFATGYGIEAYDDSGNIIWNTANMPAVNRSQLDAKGIKVTGTYSMGAIDFTTVTSKHFAIATGGSYNYGAMLIGTGTQIKVYVQFCKSTSIVTAIVERRDSSNLDKTFCVSMLNASEINNFSSSNGSNGLVIIGSSGGSTISNNMAIKNIAIVGSNIEFDVVRVSTSGCSITEAGSPPIRWEVW